MYPSLELELGIMEHFVTRGYVRNNELSYVQLYDLGQGRLESILRDN